MGYKGKFALLHLVFNREDLRDWRTSALSLCSAFDVALTTPHCGARCRLELHPIP